MEFLGKLGIDIKLLIAQIINFGLLLWLLSKFLYKPIIDKIEKDEVILKEAKVQKENLEIQKNTFEESKRKEISDVKKEARKIIKESENIVAKIKSEIHEKTNNEVLTIMNQTKDKLELLKPELKKEIIKNVRVEVENSFQESFLKTLPPSSQKEFQNIFFKDFIKQVSDLLKQVITRVEILELLKQIAIINKKNSEEKTIIKKELESKLYSKLNPVVLEYAYPLTREQEKIIEKLISGKIKIKFKINKKQNKNLINGFRFEIAGMIVENNLLNIINNITNFNE